MDVNTLVNNIANHTKSLVKRSVQKPFDFSITPLYNFFEKRITHRIL